MYLSTSFVRPTIQGWHDLVGIVKEAGLYPFRQVGPETPTTSVFHGPPRNDTLLVYILTSSFSRPRSPSKPVLRMLSPTWRAAGCMRGKTQPSRSPKGPQASAPASTSPATPAKPERSDASVSEPPLQEPTKLRGCAKPEMTMWPLTYYPPGAKGCKICAPCEVSARASPP